MNSKILFSDLDGTMLNTDKKITEENLSAVSQALSAGHKIVINTGRPLSACLNHIQELGLEREGCYAVTCNGGVIYDCYTGKVLFQKTIPLEYVRHIFKETAQRGIHCHTYSSEYVLAERMTPELQFYTDITHAPYKIIPDLLDQLVEEPAKVIAINMSGNRQILEDYRQDIKEWSDDKLSIFFSSDWYLEHVPYGVSKGAAINHLCSYLNIPLSSTVAVGDEENDISMLHTAKIGVAMANAGLRVKACADYITQNDCDHSGVAEVIHRFIL